MRQFSIIPTVFVLLSGLVNHNLIPLASATESLSVKVTGEGPPIILLPGLSGCAYGYRQVVAELVSGGFQAITIEPLGIGRSPRPEGADYSLTAQARRLAGELDSLGVEQAIVVAHGVSCSMALRLALHRPELVEAIVSLEGGLSETAATPSMNSNLKLAGMICKLGGKKVLREKFRQQLENASGDTGWLTGIAVKKYYAGYARDMDATIGAMKAMTAAVEPEPLAPRLGEIRKPVLLLIGTAPHEGCVPPRQIELFERSLPAFQKRELPGCGHYIMEEQPQAVIEAVVALARGESIIP